MNATPNAERVTPFEEREGKSRNENSDDPRIIPAPIIINIPAIFNPVKIFEKISPNFALSILSVVSRHMADILVMIFRVSFIGIRKLR